MVRESLIRDWYQYIETWWGAELNHDLVQRIRYAHPTELARFTDGFQTAVDPETIGEADLPEVEPGKLRPAVGIPLGGKRGHLPTTGMQLLLYCHEVVLPSEYFETLMWRPPLGTEGELDYRIRLAEQLNDLVAMRPLVEVGDIRFAHMVSRGRHPSAMGMYRDFADDTAAVDALLGTLGISIEDFDWGDREPNHAAVLQFAFQDLGAACSLAEAGVAQPLAQSRAEEEMLIHLIQGRLLDGRQASLKTLLKLDAPNMQSVITDLVDVRRSEASFAEFRQNLERALSFVCDLDETNEADRQRALNVVHDELTASMARINVEVSKSPALASLKTGGASLAYMGVSALTVGLLSGNPLLGLAGGAASKTVESVVSYLNAAASRRRGKQVLDLALAFTRQP